MKEFIDNSTSYNLEDVNQVMHKVEDKKEEYVTSKNKEATETNPVKMNRLYTSVASILAGSIVSLSFATTNPPTDTQKIFQQNINKADRSHNDYIKFIASQSVVYANKRNEFIEEIIAFKSLKENWDGYGAIPSENKVAVNAIALISKLKPSILNKITSIFPTPNGTISIIWENNDEERVSFEIGIENYSFYTKLNNLKPTFFEGLILDNNWRSILEEEVYKL